MNTIKDNPIARNNLRNLRGLMERYALNIHDIAEIMGCTNASAELYISLEEVPSEGEYNALAEYFNWARVKTSQKVSSRYFSNTSCEYYPCHKGANPENFNCLFCFCPLYPLSDCGGTPTYLPNGIKDCTGCLKPHTDYDGIIARLKEEMSE